MGKAENAGIIGILGKVGVDSNGRCYCRLRFMKAIIRGSS